jgi:tRNA-2-methylthio-N6-dimethylallyladenosine synthase
VVPFTRGREKSRPLTHLVRDVDQLVGRGVKEVTLLGQNVNSYESDCGAGFAQLLEKLAVETGIERIRFTTSHPKDFDDQLIDVMAKHRHKVMEYIHLPVQSGNSQVLERMNRGYTREEYVAKVRAIFKAIPDAVLSTDIITGFPGETDAQFDDTMSLLEEVPYESLFAFSYSSRPLTKAAKFVDQVPEEVKSERLNRLLKRHREIATELAEKYEGQTLDILVEKFDADKGQWQGRSSQNKLVYFDGSSDLTGTTLKVKINEAMPFVMRGTALQ